MCRTGHVTDGLSPIGLLIMLLSKLGLCVFRRLSGRMSMIDLFAHLFAQHPTCHWCLSALCWWVRCSCPLLPAISSCGHGLLVCACVGLAGGLVWFGCFFPLLLGLCGLLGGLRPFVSLVWSCWHLLRRLPFTSARSTWGPFTSRSPHRRCCDCYFLEDGDGDGLFFLKRKW